MTSSCQLAATSTVLVSPLTLYSDWHFCSACGLPPVDVDDVPVTVTAPKRNRLSTTNGENIVDANIVDDSIVDDSIVDDSIVDANTVTETNDNVGSCCDNTTKSAKKKKKKKKKTLSTCTRCKTAAYHNSECQRRHWKRGHKRDCKLLADAIQPLLDIVECWNDVAHNIHHNTTTNTNNRWWDIDTIDPKGANDCKRLWTTNEVRWNRNGEYLEAMGGFQKALEPITKLWKDRTKSATKSKSTTTTSEIGPLSLSNLSLHESSNDSPQTTTNTTALGISLARKLLFCAYCEADGNQTKSARMRLAQCVSILLECCSHHQQENKQNQHQLSIITPLLNDAWMELMLSYEEERSPELRKISRHVAHMAIQTSSSSSSSISNSSNSSSCRGAGGANINKNAMLYRCEWKDPLQRPGYMAKLERTERNNNINANTHAALAPPYVPPEDHPSWCKTLESHWKQIAEELSSLVGTKPLARRNTNANGSSNWTAVGSGDRGSGGDDHRVVSAGGKWTEYVLFGTGAIHNGNNDADAPFTKKLLKDCVPDAVSLAEAGGGEVIFSRLEPKTRIEAHCGPTNVRWTAHLGLVIPNSSCDGGENDCKIRVADKWHRWETGRVLLFDDSYEHEIRNDTNEVRIVLLLRFWHPALRRNKRQTELKEARRRKEESVEKRYHAPLV
jgi:hypothetical protein